jgi:hypothetical protein
MRTNCDEGKRIVGPAEGVAAFALDTPLQTAPRIAAIDGEDARV